MKSLHAFLFFSMALLCLGNAAPIPAHPRLFVSEQDWENLPARIKAQPEVASVIAACIARANSASPS